MSLVSQIESILFVASKPLPLKKIAKVLGTEESVVAEEIKILQAKYNQPESGVVLLETNSEFQLVSHPDNRAAAEHFMKAEVSGELTRPQLETLTVISYCGPITKPELEQIRGVNCSLILRNLLMRGLVKESDGETNLLPTYEVTMDYLQHLGINSLSDLPEYAELHNHEFVMSALNQASGSIENK
jgi:segregation and condensation protein B